MKVVNILGEEGALWNYADTIAPKPCDECTIVGMNGEYIPCLSPCQTTNKS